MSTVIIACFFFSFETGQRNSFHFKKKFKLKFAAIVAINIIIFYCYYHLDRHLKSCLLLYGFFYRVYYHIVPVFREFYQMNIIKGAKNIHTFPRNFITFSGGHSEHSYKK